MEDKQWMEYRQAMDGFPSVWERVTGGTAATQAAPGKTWDLPALIRGELLAAQEDSRLAQRFQGPIRAGLLTHCEAARRRARRLQGEYFILSGQRVPCPEADRGDYCRLDALRGAMIRDEQAAKAYGTAAADAPTGELRELLQCYARERARAGEEKRDMILSCF